MLDFDAGLRGKGGKKRKGAWEPNAVQPTFIGMGLGSPNYECIVQLTLEQGGRVV